jgi:xanthine phosphoribosyltransferase
MPTSLLEAKLKSEAKFLPNGIIVMNSFLNHQVDSQLLKLVGEEFAQRFAKFNPTKVLTAETSGLPPALATAMALQIPMVYARKDRPVTMIQEPHVEEAHSRTLGKTFQFFVASDFLTASDRFLIIDDVLATGATTLALAKIISHSKAKLVAVGHVVEKSYEDGRAKLAQLNVPIESLVKVKTIEGGNIVFA